MELCNENTSVSYSVAGGADCGSRFDPVLHNVFSNYLDKVLVNYKTRYHIESYNRIVESWNGPGGRGPQ